MLGRSLGNTGLACIECKWFQNKGVWVTLGGLMVRGQALQTSGLAWPAKRLAQPVLFMNVTGPARGLLGPYRGLVVLGGTQNFAHGTYRVKVPWYQVVPRFFLIRGTG